jgi:hypothetical protein
MYSIRDSSKTNEIPTVNLKSTVESEIFACWHGLVAAVNAFIRPNLSTE